MKGSGAVCLALFVVTFTEQSLWGQSLASVGGTIADPSKRAIPAAEVQLRNVDSHALRATTTNSAGLYEFTQASPGSYDIRVRHRDLRLR
jgi:hypothetical protein